MGKNPEKYAKESILKVVIPGNNLYYLYKIMDNRTFVSQLQGWRVEKKQYRLLTNACLKFYKTLPPTRFRRDGDIVHLEFDYLFPPQELNLWKLYTWPEPKMLLPDEESSKQSNNLDFKRICNIQVFMSLKEELEKQGYEFFEE